MPASTYRRFATISRALGERARSGAAAAALACTAVLPAAAGATAEPAQVRLPGVEVASATLAGRAAVAPTPVDLTAPASGLVGSVHAKRDKGLGGPLQAAGVYAYRLADLSLRKVLTDQAGRFSFSALPAGLYKIIAHKPGFVPAVVMLTRATSSAYQQLELELSVEDLDALGNDADFWQIRERIPRDVLREITIAHAEALEDPLTDTTLAQAGLRAEMRALTGVGDYFGAQAAALHGGVVGLEGRLGGVGLDVQGQYRQLEGRDDSSLARTIGQASALSVSVEAPREGMVRVTGHQGHLRTESEPIELERYAVSWTGDVGPGRSEVSAQYVAESNYYRDPRFASLALPPSSETLEVAGSYQTDVGPAGLLRTGLIYRERRNGDFFAAPFGGTAMAHERIDVFGLGDVDLHPDIALQYGLFTTVLEDGVAAAPHLGVVVDLGSRWQAEAAGRQRFSETESEGFLDFLPVYYGVLTDCGVVESACYRVRLSRQLGEQGKVSLAGLHREYSDAVRVYFSEDFFDQLETLFFVAGDELPEVQLVIEHRLSPNVLARFSSNVAQGGGGVFDAAAQRFGNRLAYVVTSLETRFERTETDVELAYRSVEQRMLPVGLVAEGAGRELMAVEMDRLRLLLTQNLRSLLGLSSDWAVLLDLQLSRGAETFASLANDDEIRRRVVGGIAVRF